MSPLPGGHTSHTSSVASQLTVHYLLQLLFLNNSVVQISLQAKSQKIEAVIAILESFGP